MTVPLARSWGSTCLARFTGIAKPIPTDPPLSEKMAVLMPTRLPRASTSGPPEFPGFTEASVWMKSS